MGLSSSKEEPEEEIEVGGPGELEQGVRVEWGEVEQSGVDEVAKRVEEGLDEDKEIEVGGPMEFEQHVKITLAEGGSLENIPAGFEAALMQEGLFSEDEIRSRLDDIYCCYKLMCNEPTAGELAATFSKIPIGAELRVKVYPLAELLTEGNPQHVFSKLRKLDAGSQGEVYRAINEKGTAVALKKIFIKDHKKEIPALENEISMLKSSRHPNIINYYSCHRKENTLWIAMELMNGGKLTDLIEEGYKFKEEEVSFIMKEALKGLLYLHKTGRIHRDIKSDNVLLNTDGRVKLGDFGFCAMITEGRAAKRKTVVGTPYWMAPEVIKGDPYDQKADLWSLGIMGLELCDGEPPLMSLPPMRALYVIVTQKAPRMKTRNKWSRECVDFIECTLQKDPRNRPTASDLLKHPFMRKAAAVDPNFLKKALCKV
eukprot:TRINITY_DN15818_c0_g5_i1.p1 TRINITY_DN15818_c0_g5~~TRINITY_DN15818_c0_g5_i1.p1  ORF type:complete len:427 (+),score=172.72 TRINITY_DN15818_c0_g5_i1:280-1560(+)